MYLDHKHYKQATSLTSFSVTEGTEKTIELDPAYYGPDIKPWNKIKTDQLVRQALAIEVLYDKYKNAQPFFYAANVPDDIIMPSEFFKKTISFYIGKANFGTRKIDEKIKEGKNIIIGIFSEEDILKRGNQKCYGRS